MLFRSTGGTVRPPLSAAEAVADVLGQGNQKPTFLRNIGVSTSRFRATKSKLQRQLDVEIAGKQELLMELKASRDQADADRIARQRELDDIRKQSAEYTQSQIQANALVQQLLSTFPHNPTAARLGTVQHNPAAVWLGS